MVSESGLGVAYEFAAHVMQLTSLRMLRLPSGPPGAIDQATGTRDTPASRAVFPTLPESCMTKPLNRQFRRKALRSLIKRGIVPLTEASGSYAVQHLPEWVAKTSFDFAYWLDLWTAQNPRNDRADLARLLMFIENIGLLEKEGVEGSLAELGVYQGTTAKLLHTLMPARTLWLFDTFEGFDARDFAGEDDVTRDASRFADTSLDRVLAFLGGSSSIRPCKGYFPDTTSVVPENERFALVHLDADLFKPTWDALGFFYPRMSPGGFIILHDYGSGAWPGIAEAADRFLADKAECLVRIPDKSGTAVLRVLKR
jgi:hypothetical protein